MNTSKLLGLAALTVGIGGIAYLLSAPKDSVAAIAPPVVPVLPPGEVIPSAKQVPESPSPRRVACSAGPTPSAKSAGEAGACRQVAGSTPLVHVVTHSHGTKECRPRGVAS